MKARILLTCAMAALALAGCKKNAPSSGGSNAAATDTITITQANPPPGGTWADVVNATPDGVVMGNPHAKVKLIEVGSLSCPHCRLFESEGVPTLVEKYVKPGNVSWEFRAYLIHGPIDMTANLIAHCNGIQSFFPLAQAFYADQDQWLAKIQAAPQDKLQQLQNLPPNQAFVQFASLAGLQDWAAARGVPQAKSNQCLSNQKMIDHEVQVTNDVNNQYPEFSGTPAFVINGKMLPSTVAGWDKLKPELDAALR
jgi:protein-disulfide isomerase